MPVSVKQRVGYRQVRDHLLGKIQSGRYPVSSCLPAIAEAGDEMGVSYVTAQRAYRLLAEEGIIHSVPGQRARVMRSTPSPARKPLVVGGLFRPFHRRNEADNYALDMYESACRQVVESEGSVVPRKISDRDGAERLLEDMKQERVAGVLLDEVTPDEVVEEVAATGCPAVLYGRHAPHFTIDSVSSDYEWAGRATARKILDAGYDRVVFWRDFQPRRVTSGTMKARAYASVAYRASLRDTLIEGGMADSKILSVPLCELVEQHNLWDDPAFTARVLDELGMNRRERTAFVGLTDASGLNAYAALRARGLRVPEECGVVGRFNQEVNRDAERPVTTWHIDAVEIGRTAVEVLMDRIEFPDRDRVQRYLRPVFVDHGTL